MFVSFVKIIKYYREQFIKKLQSYFYEEKIKILRIIF